MKARTKKKLKTTKKILILCEGQSEMGYISDLINQEGLSTPNISVENFEGQGYSHCKYYIEREKITNNVILIVADLDRACNQQGEAKSLVSLIRLLESLNIENNIFLTHPNFEIWIGACTGISMESLVRNGYKKNNTIPSFIRNNGGTYKKGVEYFQDKPLYFFKKEINKKGVSKNVYLCRNQSSLCYFIDYLKLLIQK